MNYKEKTTKRKALPCKVCFILYVSSSFISRFDVKINTTRTTQQLAEWHQLQLSVR